MPATNAAIARKHIELSIEIKKTTNIICKDFVVYLATHPTGESYRKIEKESGEEFWSIKARTQTSHQPLKDPDIIIADDKQVRLIVEVKWGTVEGNASTDLKMTGRNGTKSPNFLAPMQCAVSEVPQ